MEERPIPQENMMPDITNTISHLVAAGVRDSETGQSHGPGLECFCNILFRRDLNLPCFLLFLLRDPQLPFNSSNPCG